MYYVVSYMQSDTLLELEDEGMSQLLMLNDLVCKVINTCTSADPPVCVDDDAVTHVLHSPIHSLLTQTTGHRHTLNSNNATMQSQSQPSPYITKTTQSVKELRKVYDELGDRLRQCETTDIPPAKTYNHQVSKSNLMPHMTSERMVPLKDLSYLQRREFQVHGGQIDSEINCNSISKQIDEGVKEVFMEAEIVWGVLRVIKLGTFKDMLVNKDDMTVPKLKGFIRSHFGDSGVYVSSST